jgi:hypothetical protein
LQRLSDVFSKQKSSPHLVRSVILAKTRVALIFTRITLIFLSKKSVILAKTSVMAQLRLAGVRFSKKKRLAGIPVARQDERTRPSCSLTQEGGGYKGNLPSRLLPRVRKHPSTPPDSNPCPKIEKKLSIRRSLSRHPPSQNPRLSGGARLASDRSRPWPMTTSPPPRRPRRRRPPPRPRRRWGRR